MENTTVGKNLRYQRQRKGLTQEQLSESSGVTVRTIQRIENAQVEPHLQTLALLAESLELQVHDLSLVSPPEEPGHHNPAEKKWLLTLHLSPLVGFIIPFANLIVPLLLWAYKREDHPLYEEHGKAVVNFHLTVTLAFMAGVGLLLVFFQAGVLLLLFTSVYALALILWNTKRIMRNDGFKYPLSVKFI